MLKRSPRSRLMTYSIVFVGIISFFIALNALMTMQSLSTKYGARQTYYSVKETILQGDSLSTKSFVEHEMFPADAPKYAITNTNQLKGFAKVGLLKGTIVTSSMINKNEIADSDIDSRVIFIPTSEILDSSIAKYVDLVSVDPQTQIPEVVATRARILFDRKDTDKGDSTTHGYFVEVTQDESLDISVALSQGNVRFALRTNGD